MKEYDLLVSKGNIGFYNSCEVIEMFLFDNNTRKDYNLFTIVVFKEDYHTPNRNITQPSLIKVKNGDIKIGIQQYPLTLDMARENYENLINGKWLSCHSDNGISNMDYSYLKKMNKLYIPSDKSRLNNVLKNNFFNGSYVLEFFDEKKNLNCLLDDEEKFKNICLEIKKLTNINLYSTKDRLGNFIFQFPINILETQHHFDIINNSVNLDFTWHDKLVFPDCFIQIESIFDNNCVEYQIEEYNKKQKQEILINDYVPFTVRIFRKDINLLLYHSTQNLSKAIVPTPDTYNLKIRTFTAEDKDYEVRLLSSRESSTKNHITYIENSVNYEEGKILEKELTLKKYPIKKENGKKQPNPLKDICTLIEWYGERGTYIWDPFIRCNDILNTLFHSPWYNADLRALGTPNRNTSKILESEHSKEMSDSEDNVDKDLTIHQLKLKNEFEKIKSNFEGLNFEYRADIEGNSHDRFLIFPGDSANYIEPIVYSLGISVNQYGKKHHILQKVLYPQQIVDEFEKKWEKGVLIWKRP